jgi:hypothetical protein
MRAAEGSRVPALASELEALPLTGPSSNTTALSGQARTLRLCSELRFEDGEIDYLEVLAALAMRTGDGLQAVRLLTASGRLRGELGSPLPPGDELEQRIDAEEMHVCSSATWRWGGSQRRRHFTTW